MVVYSCVHVRLASFYGVAFAFAWLGSGWVGSWKTRLAGTGWTTKSLIQDEQLYYDNAWGSNGLGVSAPRMFSLTGFKQSRVDMYELLIKTGSPKPLYKILPCNASY